MDNTSPAQKACSRCGQIKASICFNKKSSNKDGRDSHCRDCRSAYRRANKKQIDAYNHSWHKNNIDSERARSAKYHATNKKKIAARKAKRYFEDSSADRRRNQEWKRLNPEQARSYLRGYRARKLRSGGKHTAEDVKALLLSQRSLCVGCRSPIGNAYHIDHIIPLSKGGSNDKLNLQLLCVRCNTSKRAKHPIDFMQTRGYLL